MDSSYDFDLVSAEQRDRWVAAGPRVSVVIPTLNEARNLEHVLPQLPEGLHEVVVVDGNSTDDTLAVVRRLRPDAVVVMQRGRGKGDALSTGFDTATGDIVVMLDADGSAAPSEIPQFVAALVAGADFAKGSRFLPGAGSTDITPLRAFGNTVLCSIVNRCFGTRYTDLCYGYNAFWRDCLPMLRVDCTGFEVETLINIRIARSGLRVSEVPSVEYERIHGESNLNTWRDGWRVLCTIGREWRHRRQVHRAYARAARPQAFPSPFDADVLVFAGALGNEVAA